MINRYHGTNPALTDIQELHGRSNAINDLDFHVLNHRSVVVMGVEGVGKSSLLNCYFNPRYRRQMALEHRILIRVTDFPTDRDTDGIYQYLAEGVLCAVDSLDQDETEAIYKKLREKCVQRMNECQDAASKFQQVCEVIQEFEYFIMLVIDGFERFVSSPHVKMEHHNLMNTLISKNLSFAVATNFDFNQDSLPAEVSGSFLLMKFSGNEIRLKGLSENDCASLLHAGDFSDDELHQLWILSGGIPAILRRAAEHTYNQKQSGSVVWKNVLQDTYDDVLSLIGRWCKLLSANQVNVLETLANNDSSVGVSFDDDTLKIAAQELLDRGLLVNPVELGTYRTIPGIYKFNTPLLKLYCKEHDLHAEPIFCDNTRDNNGKFVINVEKFSVYESGSQDNSRTYNGNSEDHSTNLTVHNIEFNQGLSTSDLLQILCGNDASVGDDTIDSRSIFAEKLSTQLRKFISDGTSTLLLPNGQFSTEEFDQRYDVEFDKISQNLVRDVDVDEEEDLTVTPAELKTLEMRFAEAKTRCRTNLPEDILSSQSERCRFYIMLSVIVEDALELPGIQMDDYSPQLVLYGKALEQSLRDNFYELFHNEPSLSVFNTYTKTEDMSSPNVFANKEVNKTLIGNYTYMMSEKKDYLASLCNDNKIQVFDLPHHNIRSWINWWEQLKCDIFEARRLRNLADHADAVISPNRENLDLMYDLLFGTSTSVGVLSRALVGKALYQQLFPPAIPLEVVNKLVGSTCHIICKAVKPNGGIKGVTCEGGYAVNISPKRVQAYSNAHKHESFNLVGMKLVVSVLECRSQDNRVFFGAEIVNICS